MSLVTRITKLEKDRHLDYAGLTDLANRFAEECKSVGTQNECQALAAYLELLAQPTAGEPSVYFNVFVANRLYNRLSQRLRKEYDRALISLGGKPLFK